MPCSRVVVWAGRGVLWACGVGFFGGSLCKRFLAEEVCIFFRFSGRARVVGGMWLLCKKYIVPTKKAYTNIFS